MLSASISSIGHIKHNSTKSQLRKQDIHQDDECRGLSSSVKQRNPTKHG